MTKFKGTSDRYLEITSAFAAQNLGPRSLAGLMIHSQFLLVRFGMPGMPIVKPVGFGMPGMSGDMPGMKLASPA